MYLCFLFVVVSIDKLLQERNRKRSGGNYYVLL